MAAFELSPWQGRISWLGVVPDREAALESQARAQMPLSYAGPEGEAHGGVTRPSCSRVMMMYPRYTEIRNTRQVTILSVEELDRIAKTMGLEHLDPALVGATLVVEGIPDLSHLPPSSRLQAEDGATLVVDVENLPCVLPARPIETRHPGHGKAFKPAAVGLRGVIAWVEREGCLHLGGSLRLFTPTQRAWHPG